MGELTAFARDRYPRELALPAITDPETFSLPAACTLSWAAQLAYESDDPAKYQSVLDDWGWTSRLAIVKPLTALPFLKGTKVFVVVCGPATIVSFAGTEPDNPGNWISDFDILRTGAGVHNGFSEGLASVWAPLSAELAKANEIYFCGHTLGAAMAALAAHRFAAGQPDRRDRVRGVYVLGMPRAGDASFAAQYNALLGKRTFRLVHGRDIVPRVPPFSIGFRHVGRVLACPSLGRFDPARLPQEAADEKSTLWFRAKDLIETVFTFDGPKGPPYPGPNPQVNAEIDKLPRFVRDHLPDRYLRALGTLKP